MIANISRLTLVFIWFYHGLVPKIIFANEQEVLMNATFLPFLSKEFTLLTSGVIELVYAVLLLVFFRSKVLLYPAIGFSVVATLAILIKIPELFENAFNPFSTNLSVLCLCLINLLAIRASADTKAS